MTIEQSLRQRAKHARCLAALWLFLAVSILVGSYVSIPTVGTKVAGFMDGSSNTPNSVSKGPEDDHLQIAILGVIGLGLFVVSSASFLLGRTALVEIELAARFVQDAGRKLPQLLATTCLHRITTSIPLHKVLLGGVLQFGGDGSGDF